MLITTQTIVDRCEKEEQWYSKDRELRIYALSSDLETRAVPYEGVQLHCEAIKYHRIRLDGYDVETTLAMMGVGDFSKLSAGYGI